MRIVRRILLFLLVLIVILVVAGAVFAWDLTRGPLPQTSGELRVSGLADRVEIIRDADGVPHIYASSLHDLFFAQGFTQAQDRWWQMEFFRHTGKGRIQELTGQSDALMGTDIFLRGIGWERAARRELESLSPEMRAVMEAFSDGVNAYIGGRAPGDLAFEYGVLGLTGVRFEIEPWTPVDTLVFAKIMQWDLGGNWDTEQYRETFIETLGQELLDSWFRPWPFGDKPTIVREEDLPITEASLGARLPALLTRQTARRESIRVADMLGRRFIFGEDSGLGSNNWVVSGSRTASGRPLLANDPHLGIRMPSIWYEIGLHCQPVSERCPVNVRGFTFSPSPSVIIGHNERIAWGVTNVGPDVQDLYRLEINPENELQYRWNGEWRDMTVVEETIRFGDGAPPVTIRVRETHLGPIINDNDIDQESGAVLGFNNESPMAMRWTALEGSTLFESVYQINQASNWQEFRDALRLWDAPSQNFVYADIDGNIGYQMPGRIPIRAEGESGLVPSTCAEDACTWLGFIAFDDLPRIFNPERGYIVTANQAVVPLEFYTQLAERSGVDGNYAFGQEWDIGYRGQRITELIEASSQHTVASMAAIHGDSKLIMAEDLAPTLAALALEDSELAGMRDWLLEWDYQLHMDSGRAALFMLFLERLTDNLFNDQLAAIDDRSSGAAWELWAITQLVDEPENPWWDDTATVGVTETPQDILTRALGQAVAEARTRLGADREQWRWGALHGSTFVSNPLGLSGITLIENMVNRGPFPTSGGAPAVNATSWNFARGFGVRSLPSMRMIVDVGGFENSLTMHTTGQSGHPFSQHYDSLIERWRRIEYHPMLFTRDQVQAAAAETLVLLPSG